MHIMGYFIAPSVKKHLLQAGIGCLAALAALIIGYYGLEWFSQWYIIHSAKTIIEKEKRGELSRHFGYVWSEINLAKKMVQVTGEITHHDSSDSLVPKEPALQAGSRHIDRTMPSLSAVRELNTIREVPHFILITDRHDFPLAQIKTTQTQLRLNEFNDVLVNTIIYAEDKNFRYRSLAYEYKSFVRAFFQSLGRSLMHLRIHRPRGTSTIHQQVAKYMLSTFDANGYVYAERSVCRKMQELKLAQALKMYCTQDELLQIYLNHCVNAGYGMTGYYDISKGLFGKNPADLDICESLYLARLVKWNRNIRCKIIAQVKIDLPRIAPAMGWDTRTQDSLKAAMDSLQILKPVRIVSEHDPLIDLANEFWLTVCKQNGVPGDEINDMDFSQPNTMIRRKGNLKIRLTIDMRLQRQLERLVRQRGFGRDTTIYTDVRIGSQGSDVVRTRPPSDIFRKKQVMGADSVFSEPGSGFKVMLHAGDTLVTNIRYRRLGGNAYRRSLFFYCRDTLHVPGQYFAYATIDSRTGELLAYYSRDGIGSRLSSLLKNKTPNGSSVAKPILYALNYDMGHFTPFSMETDSVEVTPPFTWARTFLSEKDRRTGMVYLNTSAKGGYPVSNHNKGFEGYDYLFNHLTESNNILCVEMIYRLNTEISGSAIGSSPLSNPIAALLARIGDTVLLSGQDRPVSVTGPQVYARIAGVAGVNADSIRDRQGTIPFPSDYYSVALGTLELSLYQQMHLFNVLYGNELIVNPEQCPRLVIKDIVMSGSPIAVPHNVEKRHLFVDMRNIAPIRLGLHKRLVSNPADNLGKYDIASDNVDLEHSVFPEPLSNFAKSGTTDDIIRPYNQDVVTRQRANYGLWNAVLRLTLPRQEYDSLPSKFLLSAFTTDLVDSIPESETMDVTIACVGECNERNTGARDGKSLHKYVSAGLLQRYGTPVDSGFYREYERYIEENTPDSIRFFNPDEPPDLEPSVLAEIKEKTRETRATDSIYIAKRFFFGLCLSNESYSRLLSFSPYFGKNASSYYRLIEDLDAARTREEILPLVDQLKAIPVVNPYLKAAYSAAMTDLARSISR